MPKDKDFPKWMYGPNGESKMFEEKDKVPSGWKDTPAKPVAQMTEATPPNESKATAQKMTDMRVAAESPKKEEKRK